MTVYIANPSTQPVVFYYRTAITCDNSGPLSVSIPSGEQIQIGQRWTNDETIYVISQIEEQGGAHAAEAHGSMGSKFRGLLYREIAPVSEDEIRTAHKSVQKAAEERSVTQATRSALAFDRVANRDSRHGRAAQATKVEVIQELEPHQRRTGDEAHFALEVDPVEGRSDVRLPI